jgi:lipopolysaccharide/colanic/teichoic acid biosynthesis glycosyltransferase
VSKKQTEFRKFILSVPSVISGRKSFVGPKTTVSSRNIDLGKEGLTGLWYIDDGAFSDSDKLDFYYAKNQNIWLDLEIIGKTLNKMWSKSK